MVGPYLAARKIILELTEVSRMSKVSKFRVSHLEPWIKVKAIKVKDLVFLPFILHQSLLLMYSSLTNQRQNIRNVTQQA